MESIDNYINNLDSFRRLLMQKKDRIDCNNDILSALQTTNNDIYTLGGNKLSVDIKNQIYPILIQLLINENDKLGHEIDVIINEQSILFNNKT